MKNMYAIIGIMCFLICAIISQISDVLHADEITKKTKLRNLFWCFAFFGVIDSLWGLIGGNVSIFGYWPFWILSFMFHIMATGCAYVWFRFSSTYFGYEGGKRGRIVEALPMFVAAYFLFQQLFTGKIFYIDDNYEYHVGGLRQYLFYIQFFYYLYALVKWAVFRFLAKKSGENPRNLRHTRIVYFFLIIPVVSGILQMINPDEPYYSIGFIIMATVVFDGTIVIDKNQDSLMFEKVSKETFEAFEALGQSYVSVHVIDLVSNLHQSIKSTSEIDFFINPKDPANVQIRKVMEGVTIPEYTSEMVEFVDLSTLPERMRTRDKISLQFIGNSIGWCESMFLCVQRDSDGNVTKVIHAVSDIDEAKRKEQEYTLALTRAYQNKNAIYAEILQMQNVGVTATDKDNKVILANDMALHQFNKDGMNVEGMDFLEFINDGEFTDSEDAYDKYYDALENGGSFVYEMKVNYTEKDSEGRDKEKVRYLMNSGRLLELLDGTRAMLNCYTDVTESKLLEEKLRIMSEVDALTQISNRGCGEGAIEELIEENTEGLFCLIDVNKFKSINDSYGHKAGDDVLTAVAKCLKQTFRVDDIVMRLGGDEFAIYAKNVTSKELAEIRLARLFDNLKKIKVEGVPKTMISISLGAVLVKATDGVIKEDYPTIYRKADSVMYECKDKGGNNLKFYED